jgi:hypothetical protein
MKAPTWESARERMISIMGGAGLVVALSFGRRDADTRQGG